MLKQKTFKDNRFFEFLDFIFKKSDRDLVDYKPSNFLVNRWISMVSPLYCKIINMTTNKWMMHSKDFDTKKFYRTILPFNDTRINYIKKSDSIKEDEEDCNLAEMLECSDREIKIFKSTIEELNLGNK